MPRPDDLARIAFVTRAYPRMRTTILSVVFGPAAIWLTRCVRQGDAHGTLLAAVVLVAVLPLAGMGERWLDRRFGRVIRDSDETGTRAWKPALGGGLAGLVSRFEEWSLRSGGFSVILLGLAVVGLWMTLRDWPHRPQTLIFLAACLTGACALGAMSHRADLLEWRMRADAGVIVAWMVVGVGDLVTLCRVLPGPQEADANEHAHTV